MTDLSAKPTHLVTLPLELLHFVIHYTTKKEQKSLRASSRFLNKLLTPLLFESFNVYPHVRSFEYFIKAAETPHIGPLIRKLRYDAGYLGVTDMIVRRLHSVYSASISQKDMMETIDHARMLHDQSLPADNTIDELALMSYLTQAFAHLPNLKSIKLMDAFRMCHYGGETGGRLPSFYEQLANETCGRFEHTRLERGMIGAGYARTTYARTLLMALNKLEHPLEGLKMQRVRWASMLEHGDLNKHAKFWEKSFIGLKSLELSTAADNMPVTPNTMANLQALLKPAIELEELSITFRASSDARYSGHDMEDPNTGLPCQSHFYSIRAGGPRSPNTVQAKLSWSTKLRKLRLAGLICTKSEIRTLLKHSAPTLTRLEIHDFVLMPDELPGNRACLVSLIKWIQKHLRLDEVRFSGSMINGGMQDWFIPPRKVVDGDLLSQVEKFVLKGGVNPLEHVAIQPGYFDLDKKTYVGGVPERLNDDEFGGDWSLQMQYESFDEPEEDEDDEDDGGDDEDDGGDDDLLGMGLGLEDEDLDDDDDEDDDEDEDGYPLGGPWHPDMPFARDYFISDESEDDEFDFATGHGMPLGL